MRVTSVLRIATIALGMLVAAHAGANANEAFGIKPDLQLPLFKWDQRSDVPPPHIMKSVVERWSSIDASERARFLRLSASSGYYDNGPIPMQEAARLILDESEPNVRFAFFEALKADSWKAVEPSDRARLFELVQDSMPLLNLTAKLYDWREFIPAHVVGEIALRSILSLNSDIRYQINGYLTISELGRQALADEVRRVMKTLPHPGSRRAFADRLMFADEDTLRWSVWKPLFDPAVEAALSEMADAEDCESILAAQNALF